MLSKKSIKTVIKNIFCKRKILHVLEKKYRNIAPINPLDLNMKKQSILLAILFVFASVFAQPSKLTAPQKVVVTFSQKYKNVTNLVWTMEDETVWLAEFQMKEQQYSAAFDSDGTWKYTEYKIERKALPKAIIKTLSSEYEDYTIGEIEVTESERMTIYRVNLESDDESMQIMIDANGRIIEEEGDDEEETDNK